MSNKTLNPMVVTVASCLAALSLSMGVVQASSAEEVAYTAATTADAAIPTDELELLLTPLTVDELVVEADAWMALLKAKAHEISNDEIAAKHKSKEIEQAEGGAQDAEAAKLDEAKRAAEAEEEVKSGLLDGVNVLRTERTALIDRLNVVLGELEEKGGETDAHRKYAAAVSGMRLDVSDTSAAWATVEGWALSDEGGRRWIRNLAIFLGTVIAFWMVAAVLGKAAHKLLGASRNATALMQEFMAKSVRRVVFAVGVIVGLSALEVDIGPLLALIGAAGFVVAFALQDTLGNFASGIMILLYRPFDVGDLVDIAGVTGKVATLNLVSVTINTLDNKVVVVPNNAVWGNVITNATGSSERRVDMLFGIGYGDDIEKAQRLLEQTLESHPLVLSNPEPIVRLHELGDSSVNFVCRPWTKTDDYWTVYWDVTRAVKEAFDANGVSIPFPQRDLHLYHVTEPAAPSPAAQPTAHDGANTHQAEDFPESPDTED